MNVRIEENVFDGTGWNFTLGNRADSVHDIHVINNRFRPTGYGPRRGTQPARHLDRQLPVRSDNAPTFGGAPVGI